MEVRLADADRERLGCEEWLDLSLDGLPVEIAEAIEEAGGVWENIYTKGAKGARVRVWIALHQAGITVPWAEFTFDLARAQWRDEAAGKAPSGDGVTPTPPKSARSTRRSTRSRSTS
jgi:hypothetical protein